MPEKKTSPISEARRSSLHKQLKYWTCSDCEVRNYNLGREDCFRCKSKKSRTAGEVCAALQTLSEPKPVETPENVEKVEKVETPTTPKKTVKKAKKSVEGKVQKQSPSIRRNSLRTITPKKKSDMPCWECASCQAKNFNVKRMDCFRCKTQRAAGEVAHLQFAETIGQAVTHFGNPHVNEMPPEGYTGEWTPEYHEGQIVDALYRKKEADEGKWMPARITGVDYRAKTYEVNFNMSAQKNGIQQLDSKKILGVGSGVLIEAEGPWKGNEGVIVGYRHSRDLWRIELADGRRKNVKLGGLLPKDLAGAINREAGAV